MSSYHNKQSRMAQSGSSKLPVIVTIVTLAVFVGFIAWLSWFNGSVIVRGLFTSGRGGWIFIIGFVLLLAAIIFALVSYDSKRVAQGTLAVVAAVGIFAVIIIGWVRIGYDTAKQYAVDINTSENAVNSYGARAPYEVAQASATRNLQDTRGDVQGTKSLADQSEHGTWNTLVVRRGFAQGYESLQTLDLPLYGTPSNSAVQLCKFDTDATLRLGGAFPHNNLSREILQQVPLNVTLMQQDAYGSCSDGTPYVIVPLKQVEGFYAPTWTSYGVAIYNGKTGDVSIYTKADDISKIHGPTYPLTLADQQRAALGATGGLWDYKFGRTGYEASSSNTEVQLRNVDSGTDTTYVTALTPKGASANIVGFVSVDAQFAKSMTRNKLELNKLSGDNTYDAISTQVDNIKTSYSNLTGWVTGLEIFEVTPGENGSWVASIGKSQSVLYRAIISEVDGITFYELYDKDGNLIPDATSGGTTNTDGNTDSGTGTPIDLPAGTDLSSLTNDQLKQLGQEIVNEYAARLAAE
jgi:hypothetical protein